VKFADAADALALEFPELQSQARADRLAEEVRSRRGAGALDDPVVWRAVYLEMLYEEMPRVSRLLRRFTFR
jgi:hypothetical protein